MPDVFLYQGESNPSDVKLRDPTSVAVSVAYSLAGAAGSYAISGQSATFKTGRLLSGSAGSYAISGQAGTFAYTPGSGSVAYSLSGAAGSYVISGQSGTFQFSGVVEQTQTASVPVGGKRKHYQFTPFSPGRLQAELAQQQARNAIQEAFAKAVEDSSKTAAKPVKPLPIVSFTATELPEPMADKLAADLAAYEKFADDLQKATLKKMALEDDEAFAILMIAIEA